MNLTYDDAETRINDLIDDSNSLCGFIRTGHDDSAVYYIATTRGTYEDHEMLNIRYVALGHAEWREDTFLKNGISIRLTDGIEPALVKLLVGSINGNDDPSELYDEV